MKFETPTRSLVKTISYRAVGSLTTAIFVLILTGELAAALAVGGLEIVSKMFLFYFHERVWTKIPFGKHEIQPAVIWITGLSGSKKKELAEQVCELLKARKLKVEWLNGDNIRSVIPNIGFSKSERLEHIKRVGYFASILEKSGTFVVCSFISPDLEARNFVRKTCRKFIEIHVNTPVEKCRENDEHGIYAKADAGLLTEVAGVHYSYEETANINLRVDLSKHSIEERAQNIVEMCGV